MSKDRAHDSKRVTGSGAEMLGPRQHVLVTPAEEDVQPYATASYEFDVHPEATSKDVGMHIARAIKGGMPKPAKVEWNPKK